MCANEQTFATKWYDDDMFMIEAIAILHNVLMCCGFNFDEDVANAFFPIILSEAWIIMNKFHKGSATFFFVEHLVSLSNAASNLRHALKSMNKSFFACNLPD